MKQKKKKKDIKIYIWQYSEKRERILKIINLNNLKITIKNNKYIKK